MKTVKLLLSSLLIILTLYSFGENTENFKTSEFRFTENKGQIVDFDGNTHPEILFELQANDANIYFTKKGLSYYFYKNEEIEIDPSNLKTEVQKLNAENGPKEIKSYYYRMDMLFANTNNNNIKITPLGESKAYSNFYLPSCPDGILNVKQYKSIRYSNVYKGIDFVFSIVNGKLKYNIEINPGANFKNIEMLYDGVTEINKISSGELLLKTPIMDFTESMPDVYYSDNHESIDCNFEINNNIVSFNIPKINNNRQYIIDPVQYWSTYFDYNLGSNTQNARPVFDSQGNIYNAGRVQNTGFPLINAGGGQYYQSTMSGTYEVIIYKFNSSNDLQWSTYYGASMSDNVAWPGRALAMDDNDNLFVLMNIVGGGSSGGTFPTYNPGGGAFYQNQSKMYDWYNSAIGEFDSNGVRKWVTIISHENSNTDDQDFTVWGISSKNNKIYFTGISGTSNSNTIPLRNLSGAYYQSSEIGSVCPFVGRFSNTGVLEWCTYLHSGNSSYTSYNGQGYDVQMDANNNLWFVGATSTSSGSGQGHLTMDPGGAYYQPTTLGSSDIIFTKFDANLQPVWSSYYGGASTDGLDNITSDSKGNMYIVGYTYSSDIDTYNPGGGAFFRASTANNSNITNNYIAKFSSDYQLAWATTYSENSTFTGVECGNNDNVYVYGTSPGTAFVAQSETGSYNDNSYNGGNKDYVFLKFDSLGARKWATFYGGTDDEGGGITGRSGMNIFFNPCSTTSKIVIFGGTKSTDFPTHNSGGGALFQSTKSSSGMGPVIVEFNETTTSGTSTTPTSITASVNPICSGSSTTLTLSGGSLGTGASWHWYTGSCGGTSVGTGSSITVSPTSTITYYVRAEGTCNTTACVSKTITVSTNSSAASSISATNSTICSGSSTTLTLSGGNLGTGASWHWYTGSCGGTSAGTGSSITVSPTSTITYYVRAEGTCNTTACVSKTITVSTNSSAASSISATNSTICSGSSTTLTLSGGSLGTGASWHWYTGSCGGTSAGTGSSITVSPTSTITYYVRAEGTCNTTACVNITITVNDVSIAATSISASINPVCEGNATTLTLSGGSLGTGATWIWYEGGCGNGSSIGSGTSITINPTSSSSYYVRAEGSCNTTSCASIAITVTPGANAGIDGNISLCQNDAVIDLFSQLGGSPSGGGTWTNSSGTTISNIFDPTTMSGDIFTYTVTGTAPCGNDSATVTVTVNPLPNVSFLGLDSIYCGTGTVILTGNHAPSGTFSGTNIIDNGNGTANFNYATPGTHNIIYTYSNGCTNIDTQVVTVYTMPSVNFVGLDTAYCEGISVVNIIGNQSPNGTFSGTGIIDNGNGTATYTPSTTGQQIITYEYTDGNSCTAIDSQIVNVHESPNIDSLIVTNVSCSGNDGTIQSQVSGGNGSYSYLWSNNDTTTSIDSLLAGNYTLTVTDGYGCSSDETATVQTSSSGLSINITNITNVDCNGNNTGSTSVDVSGTGTYTYLWSNGDTTITADSLYAGYYYVTVQDSFGCQGVDSVLISEPDILTYNDSIINISCYGYNNGEIYLNVTGGTPNYSYSWQGGSGFTSTNEYLTNLSPGEYTVTVTDINGCHFDVDKISVIQPDTSLYTLVNTNPPLCYGNSNGTAISTAAGGTPPYIYNWSNGDVGSSTTNLGDGEYFLTVTDANFCTNIDTIILNSPEKVDVSENITNASCIGNNNGQILVSVKGGVTPYDFVWNTDPVQTDSIATNLTAGTYTLTITDFNKCSQVYIYDIADGNDICLEIPTAITPNSDGTNDDWELKGIWIYENIHIEIYNRWGDMIFSFDGTGTDYDSNRWNGTYNGKELPISSYVFIIDLKDGNEPIQGVITIIK